MDEDLNFETPLAEYLRKEGVSAYEMSRRTGNSYKQICAWRDGFAMPDLVNAFRLDRAANGKIPPVLWLGTPLGKERWAKVSNWSKWQEQRRDAAQRRRDARPVPFEATRPPDTIPLPPPVPRDAPAPVYLGPVDGQPAPSARVEAVLAPTPSAPAPAVRQGLRELTQLAQEMGGYDWEHSK